MSVLSQGLAVVRQQPDGLDGHVIVLKFQLGVDHQLAPFPTADAFQFRAAGVVGGLLAVGRDRKRVFLLALSAVLRGRSFQRGVFVLDRIGARIRSR